jgi:hypothetical protein
LDDVVRIWGPIEHKGTHENDTPNDPFRPYAGKLLSSDERLRLNQELADESNYEDDNDHFHLFLREQSQPQQQQQPLSQPEQQPPTTTEENDHNEEEDEDDDSSFSNDDIDTDSVISNEIKILQLSGSIPTFFESYFGKNVIDINSVDLQSLAKGSLPVTSVFQDGSHSSSSSSYIPPSKAVHIEQDHSNNDSNSISQDSNDDNDSILPHVKSLSHHDHHKRNRSETTSDDSEKEMSPAHETSEESSESDDYCLDFIHHHKKNHITIDDSKRRRKYHLNDYKTALKQIMTGHPMTCREAVLLEKIVIDNQKLIQYGKHYNVLDLLLL